MNTYIVSGTITVSCWTLVEADSEEEAVKIASGREIAQFQIDDSSGFSARDPAVHGGEG